MKNPSKMDASAAGNYMAATSGFAIFFLKTKNKKMRHRSLRLQKYCGAEKRFIFKKKFITFAPQTRHWGLERKRQLWGAKGGKEPPREECLLLRPAAAAAGISACNRGATEV
jgi:ribosomal protein L33